MQVVGNIGFVGVGVRVEVAEGRALHEVDAFEVLQSDEYAAQHRDEEHWELEVTQSWVSPRHQSRTTQSAHVVGSTRVFEGVGVGEGVEELEEHKEEPLVAHSAEDDAAQLVEEHKLVWETHSPELPHHHWSM